MNQARPRAKRQTMNQPKKKIDFESLNLIGKAVYLGGATFRFFADSIDAAVNRAVDIYIDAEKAFKEGIDPNIEDAKILDERTGKDNVPETTPSGADTD